MLIALAGQHQEHRATGSNTKGRKTNRSSPRFACGPWCQRTSPNPLGGCAGNIDPYVLNIVRIASPGPRFKGFLETAIVQDRKITPEMVPVIKLARARNIPYSWISGYYFGLNFGRIADVVKGRLFPDIPPATALPADFPVAA